LQSYLHIFGFLDDFHFGASFGTFTGVLELSLEFPVDMEYVKGVFFDFTRDAATVLYSRFLVELRSARDAASDGLCGGRLSVHAFISGIWHGHAHPNRTKNQQVGEAGRTDDERTNGQMDERTSQQIGLYRGFNNGYGVGHSLQIQKHRYRYSI